jgi:hypothetical protein
MKLIQTQTLGTAQSSIVFSDIPQTFTDLYALVSSRSDGAFTSSEIDIAFNGSSSNFSGRYLYGSGSGAGSSATDTTMVGSSSAANNTSNTFGNASIYIPNYTSSNNKSISSDTVGESNATTAYMSIHAVLWSQTAAITSLTLSLDGGVRNFVSGSSVSLYGIGPDTRIAGAKATGGTVQRSGDYWVHTFTASGTFTPTADLTNVEYLVVAGGGGGGSDNNAGGGGAGGYRCSVVGESSGGGAAAESRLSLTSGTNYTVTVGAGGSTNSDGANSVFGSVTSNGGGRGGRYSVNTPATGGSGGGGATNQTGAVGITGQGYSGGNGLFGTYDPGGGGGGASAIGTNSNGTTAGNGGAGVTSVISGSSVARSGGGGGAAGSGGIAYRGTGGNGGGGAGGYSGSVGVAGTANTGGGGGGKAAGGSGIVIVRYPA